MEKTMKITIFHENGTQETFEQDVPIDPEYDVLKPLCDRAFSGYMEHVTVFFEGRYTDMFVDEESKLKGQMRNEAATAIYRNNAITHMGVSNPETLDYIAGGALLFHEPISPLLSDANYAANVKAVD
jgi:hypothetical protein